MRWAGLCQFVMDQVPNAKLKKVKVKLSVAEGISARCAWQSVVSEESVGAIQNLFYFIYNAMKYLWQSNAQDINRTLYYGEGILSNHFIFTPESDCFLWYIWQWYLCVFLLFPSKVFKY